MSADEPNSVSLRIAVIDDEAVIGVSCRRAWRGRGTKSSILAIRRPG